MVNNISLNERPKLADYITKWSLKYLAPSQQEISAREEYARDLCSWYEAEIERLQKLIPTSDYVLVTDMSEENSKRWGKGLFCGFDNIKSVS